MDAVDELDRQISLLTWVIDTSKRESPGLVTMSDTNAASVLRTLKDCRDREAERHDAARKPT